MPLTLVGATGRKTGSEDSLLQNNEVQFLKKRIESKELGNKCRIWQFSSVSCACRMKIRRSGRESRGLFREKQAEKFKNFVVWGVFFLVLR